MISGDHILFEFLIESFPLSVKANMIRNFIFKAYRSSVKIMPRRNFQSDSSSLLLNKIESVLKFHIDVVAQRISGVENALLLLSVLSVATAWANKQDVQDIRSDVQDIKKDIRETKEALMRIEANLKPRPLNVNSYQSVV